MNNEEIIYITAKGSSYIFDDGNLYVAYNGIKYFISDSADNKLVKYINRKMRYVFSGKPELSDLMGQGFGFYYDGYNIVLDYYYDSIRGIGDIE